MLTHFQIQNFIIIEKVELDFTTGLSVITGETGAGKSIIIDALTMLLGGRTDSSNVGPHDDKCSLSACFELKNLNDAKNWLLENDFADESESECILRRVIHRDGKTKQMINGHPCTLQQIKDFLPLLINIHSQNQHQLLTKRSQQRNIVDSFGNYRDLCEKIRNIYDEWFENQKKIQLITERQKNGDVQQELIEHQFQEFEKLAVLPNEYEELDQEHKQLANADQLIRNCQEAVLNLTEAEKTSAQNRLYQARNNLQNICHFHEKISDASELIGSALIQLEEASMELRNYLSQIEVDPNRLNYVEERLSKLHTLARKHQVAPNNLAAVQEQLGEELSELKNAHNEYKILHEKSQQLARRYFEAAKILRENRAKAAQLLNNLITEKIQQLGMPGGQFSAVVTPTEEITPYGADEIEFLVSANRGQSLQPLHKVASGGEISRIALAIYVVTAQKKTTPILVFDEVDVGIGGGTAAIVGNLLKELSKAAQVLCITHLPQVAAYGDQHFQVQKKVESEQTITRIIRLDEEQRIEEVARMLGGMTITEKTLAHARELVANA